MTTHSDRRLRAGVYNGWFGRHYDWTWKLLGLPIRSPRVAVDAWLLYAIALAALAWSIVNLSAYAVAGGAFLPHLPALIVLFGAGCLAVRHPWLAWVALLAIPVRIAGWIRPFVPRESFREIHERVLTSLRAAPGRLLVLDVATGTCQSLARHGWLTLNAGYIGVDLSEARLRQGRAAMAALQAPIELALADAQLLPFADNSFDVVLNYGAVNGVENPAQAISEMARVARPGGLLLFYDEQLDPAASAVEGLYFRRALAAHDTVQACPAELPPVLTQVSIQQVYRYYYLCTAIKQLNN